MHSHRLRHMRHTLIIGAAIVAALFFTPSADALTIQGGTEAQRAYAQEVIEDCWLDWQWVDERAGGVDVTLEPVHAPYWGALPSEWDGDAIAAGLAWPGSICVDSRYTGKTLGEIVSHEWAHQIWYGVPASLRAEWKEMVGPWDSASWYTSPAEAWAECMRIALFPSEHWLTDYPRTNLADPGVDACREFVMLYRWSTNCPFVDLTAEDPELRAAAGYLAATGIIQGYPDGTFGPYAPLLKRHVALICARAGLEVPDWLDDYTPALRSDLRSLPLTWHEARWSEGITRGQMARLLYRSR